MLRKVTHCAGHVSANARPHQLRWGDREMGTAISCTECSQVAGLIQKLVETHARPQFVDFSFSSGASATHNAGGWVGIFAMYLYMAGRYFS